MTAFDLAAEIILDLLRSSWVIESSRRELYTDWSVADPSYLGPAERADERAILLASELETLARIPDHDLVQPHSGWMRETIGDEPLGPMFLIRLAGWVDAHLKPFLKPEMHERLKALSAEDEGSVKWPSSMPTPKEFEPLTNEMVGAPGTAKFRFAILGDMHIGSAAGERAVRAAIADINRSDAELVIQLGDITDHGDAEEFRLAREVLETLHAPVTTIIGNHDVLSLGEDRLSGREYFAHYFGREPDGALLEHKGFRFAALDSADHSASPFGPFDLSSGTFTDGRSGAIVRGSLTYPQHDLLADIAGPGGGPAFVFLHHPPQPFVGFPPILFGLRDSDSGRLHAVADSGNVWGVFAGHTHRNARTRSYGAVPVQEVAIPRDFPFGYALVDVGDEGYAFNFMQITDEAYLRSAAGRTTPIHQRYGLGAPDIRNFIWTRP